MFVCFSDLTGQKHEKTSEDGAERTRQKLSKLIRAKTPITKVNQPMTKQGAETGPIPEQDSKAKQTEEHAGHRVYVFHA